MVGPVDTDNWLTIIGLGEDGPDGLSPASRAALDAAEIIMGAARHLELVPEISAEKRVWPVPFADGVPELMGLRGRRVVVLASGDPFWFGAGSVLARELEAHEWRAIPTPSAFSLAAARLGWPLEAVLVRGLHAAPFERLRPDLAPGRRLIVTLRDGDAVKGLAEWLAETGFGDSTLHLMEALGGPRERVRTCQAKNCTLDDVQHPVVAAVDVAGQGAVVHCAGGQADDLFDHDGQITKRPLRAMTLSALAPKPGELLWDVGAGSGSIALEWLMADPSTEAVALEARADRATRIRANANALGQDRLQIVQGRAPEALAGLPAPQAVFVGGGLSAATLSRLETNLPLGTRLVVNAVTLETEALLVEAAARLGGTLTKIEMAEAKPLGRFRGWKAAYPLVQWSVSL
ncbi:MAG: precorrin-6y C5,15-methyltransferase (decarboxylating) subunit CbiE [Pseudomonadota bacterium]